MRVCAVVVTCALAGASLASAQSLADVARKEGERRQEITPTSKTYTNSDLKTPRGSTAEATPAAGANSSSGSVDAPSGAADNDERDRQADASPASSSDKVSAPASDSERAEASGGGADSETQSDGEAKTADAANEATADENGGTDSKGEQYWAGRMSRLREQLERNETFLNALQSRVNALTTDFVNRDDPAQRDRISSERQKAINELERLEKQIQADRKAIPELEEEARRAGIPAGWLR